MEKFIITFGFDNDGEYTVNRSKPIPASDEQQACNMLIDQFENYEGVPLDILIVTKL
jgi:hypothetical protein